jgi:hypothetical protein
LERPASVAEWITELVDEVEGGRSRSGGRRRSASRH